MTSRSKLLLGATTIATATLLLAACGSDSSGGSSSSASSPAASSAAAASPSGSASASAEASPSDSAEEIFVSLCDEVTAEQEAAIRGVLKPDYKVSQLLDVRTDDDGMHAILGFVEGPGLSVLAVWTGTGPNLDNLAAAEEFAASASTAALQTPDAETQKLVDATPECYSTLFAPQADTGDKDKKKN